MALDYGRLRQDALDQANGDRGRAAEIVADSIENLAIAGDSEAIRISLAAHNRGYRADLDGFCRTSAGRLTLALLNVSIPAGKSVHRRAASGDVEQLYLPFLDMLFGEIHSKLAELAGQRDQLVHAIIACGRLLELEASVPGAATPREALSQLGITAEDWLAR